MDTVILAGGRGSRLTGLVPEFHKPLVPINGSPLVAQAVEHGLKQGGLAIVVTAPGNTELVHQALPDHRKIRLVVQRHPDGPGAALLLGLEAASSDRVMVLMADNLMSSEDVLSVARQGEESCAVAVRVVPMEDAMRFTRIVGTHTYEGDALHDDERGETYSCVWVGPLVIDRKKAVSVLKNADSPSDGRELKIGPFLPKIAPDFVTVDVESCFDVGAPAALKEHTQ